MIEDPLKREKETVRGSLSKQTLNLGSSNYYAMCLEPKRNGPIDHIRTSRTSLTLIDVQMLVTIEWFSLLDAEHSSSENNYAAV